MSIHASYLSRTQTLYKELKAADTISNQPGSLNSKSGPDGFISYETPAINTALLEMTANPEAASAINAIKKNFNIHSEILAVSFLTCLDSADNPEGIVDGALDIHFINTIADDPNIARRTIEMSIQQLSKMYETLCAMRNISPELSKCLAELPTFLATLRSMYGIYS